LELSAAVKRPHIPSLDGIRAVSVLIVILYHGGIEWVPGDLGVSSFFVLSGFLITWLLFKEEDRTGTVSLKSFYVRRLLRIFPAYYAFFAVSIAFDYIRGYRWDHALIYSGLLYVTNYYNALHGHPPSAIAHAWSLAIEEQFYLLWPFLFLTFRRRKEFLISAIVMVCLWRSYLYGFRGVSTAYVYNAFDTRFDNLAIGCLLATLLHAGKLPRWMSKPSNLIALAALGLLVISRSFSPQLYHYTLGFTVDALLISIVIVQAIMLHDSGLWKALEYPASRYIGKISYPMYLYHIWAIGAALRLHKLPIPSALLITVLLASGSYYVIEKPFLRLKSRWEPDV
jgi:peptidoglycan/LPS O-acetylase OafA/YrhL